MRGGGLTAGKLYKVVRGFSLQKKAGPFHDIAYCFCEVVCSLALAKYVIMRVPRYVTLALGVRARPVCGVATPSR